jgi:N-acetylmuramoyl-L-alanine amidase
MKFARYRLALAVTWIISMTSPALAARLSPLAPAPDWKRLEAYQQTITREEFIRLVNEAYSPDGGFWKYCQLGDDRVLIFSDTTHLLPLATLCFAADEASCRPRPIDFTPQKHLSPQASPERPLDGLHICLDPGHVGGEWAKTEERFFQVDQDPPVEEAELNWITCQHIAQQLGTLGARVSWSKNHNEPVTRSRPGDLRDVAIQSLLEGGNWPTGPISAEGIRQQIDFRANALFYRSAEIFARAEAVNKLKPDLILCIHYNAAPWGTPGHPQLVDQSKLVVFVNGAYQESELSYDDEKLNLLIKLLDNTYPLELRGANFVAEELLRAFNMPAETYTGWNMVKKVGTQPSVFARNLLATRTFRGPVVFVEGPYMNARDAYPRLIAGDYDGTRLINGVEQPSIFREYAHAVTAGVVRYFSNK